MLSGILSKLTHFFDLLGKALGGSEEDFTKGSINRAIFLLSIPMIFEMAMESLLAVVDIYFISRLHNNDAVTAVGLTEQNMAIIYSVAMGMGMAGTAMVARRIGEKDTKGAAQAGANALYLGVVMSIVISIVGVIFYKDILRLMGASESVINVGSGYTFWMFAGNITIMGLFLINAVFRGAGNAAIAMHSLWIANITNMVLDPLLIFGYGPFPEWGVEGAAIATNIGRGTGVAYQLYCLFGKRTVLQFTRATLKASKETMVRLLKLSAGNIGQFLIATLSWLFLGTIVVSFGSDVYAGYQFAIRVIIFTILPSWGMANAAATLVGQNLGANQPERAELSVWRAGYLNMAFLGLLSLGFFFFSDLIMGIFSTDPVVIEYGSKCLLIVAVGYVFYGMGMVVVQSFNGAGDTTTPTVMNLFTYWFFQVPLAYMMAHQWGFGATGAFWAIAIAESVMAVIAILIFRRGKWKTVKV